MKKGLLEELDPQDPVLRPFEMPRGPINPIIDREFTLTAARSGVNDKRTGEREGRAIVSRKAQRRFSEDIAAKRDGLSSATRGSYRRVRGEHLASGPMIVDPVKESRFSSVYVSANKQNLGVSNFVEPDVVTRPLPLTPQVVARRFNLDIKHHKVTEDTVQGGFVQALPVPEATQTVGRDDADEQIFSTGAQRSVQLKIAEKEEVSRSVAPLRPVRFIPLPDVEPKEEVLKRAPGIFAKVVKEPKYESYGEGSFLESVLIWLSMAAFVLVLGAISVVFFDRSVAPAGVFFLWGKKFLSPVLLTKVKEI